ncbi:MAG: peptidase [Geobacteraceae bacterium GWC2_58_44]|nr:MAG: peptidase [Geobacteraceae bacterium GWC2_58_44]HBG07944.1 peptidase [Geobacter sp.]
MTTDNHNQITTADAAALRWPQSASDDAAAAGGGEADGSGTGAAAPLPGKGNGRPLRQLLRNLRSGVRISLALRTDADRLCATPGALALLAVADFVLNLSVSFLLVGGGGSFSYPAVPSFFFHLPLLLCFGLLAGCVLSRPSLVTVIPVALVALSIPIELAHALIERMAQLRQLEWLADYLVAPNYYRFFWWWIVAAFIFLLRLKPGASARQRITVLLLFLVLVLPPLWFFPRADLWVSAAESGESGELHLTEEVLAAQARLLDGRLAGLLPGKKGVSDLYFVGFAGDATQDVFLKELRAAEGLFNKRFGTFERSVVLANNPKSGTTVPFASAGNLERAISGVGKVMNRDEDVLFLYLTSHGSREHELAVSNPPLELNDVTPEKLRRMLKNSGVTWKVLVVSACYAGGFIDPLKDDHSLIITAADESHESFGCGYGEEFTWFGQAYLDEALRSTFSFTEAFETARETIRQWEEEQGETPSNPQIWMGKAMGEKLAVLEKQLAERSGGAGEAQ